MNPRKRKLLKLKSKAAPALVESKEPAHPAGPVSVDKEDKPVAKKKKSVKKSFWSKKETTTK